MSCGDGGWCLQPFAIILSNGEEVGRRSVVGSAVWCAAIYDLRVPMQESSSASVVSFVLIHC